MNDFSTHFLHVFHILSGNRNSVYCKKKFPFEYVLATTTVIYVNFLIHNFV